MAATTKGSARTAARFGRTGTSSSAGRFARQGAGTSSRRFARPGTSASRPRRTSQRTSAPWARSSGQTPSSPWARTRSRRASSFASVSRRKSKTKGLAGTFAGMLPTGAAAKATPNSKKGKAGGLLVLAAAAGVALRNRDKLTAMVGRDRGSEPREEPVAGPVHDAGPTVPRPGDTPSSVARPESGAPTVQPRDL